MKPKSTKQDAPADVQRLAAEIAQSRRRLDEYVDELDRRRHRLVSMVKPARLAIVAASCATALLAVVVLRRRARRGPRLKVRDLRGVAARVLAQPDRVASQGRSGWAKALSTVVPIVVRSLAKAATQRASTASPWGQTRRREKSA